MQIRIFYFIMIIHLLAQIEKNSKLPRIFKLIGIEFIILPIFSLELNPIKLVFNAIAQRFSSQFI